MYMDRQNQEMDKDWPGVLQKEVTGQSWRSTSANLPGNMTQDND